MSKIFFILYNYILLPLLFTAFHFIAIFNSKVKRGLKDRRKLFEKVILDFTGMRRSKKIVWFHSASLGEFEQAKPIIEKLKKENNVHIHVTFFSPSGYENSLKYKFADTMSYLPFDQKRRVRNYINIVKPDLLILMRYDIWPNLIFQLKKKNVPVLLVDATMREKSARKFPGVKSFHIKLFDKINKVLAISEVDVENFKDFKISKEKIDYVGDTRFDRVFGKAKEHFDKILINEKILLGKKIFLVGSSWEADESVLFPAIKKLLKYDSDTLVIICPHEPTVPHLENIEQSFSEEKTIRFSYLNNYVGERIIIIDSIGILLSLYKYASFAFVGGSFKQGIHNVLEPAVYGLPVLFGPKIDNSQEAQKLQELGSGIVIHNKKEAYRIIRKLSSNNKIREGLGLISKEFVENRIGATDKITKEIISYLK